MKPCDISECSNIYGWHGFKTPSFHTFTLPTPMMHYLKWSFLVEELSRCHKRRPICNSWYTYYIKFIIYSNNGVTLHFVQKVGWGKKLLNIKWNFVLFPNVQIFQDDMDLIPLPFTYLHLANRWRITWNDHHLSKSNHRRNNRRPICNSSYIFYVNVMIYSNTCVPLHFAQKLW